MDDSDHGSFDSNVDLALIGGTGIYELVEVELPEQHQLDTPFGTLAAPLTMSMWRGRRVAFLPRHGAGHQLPPHLINYRANIWALSQLNPARVIAINSVGSMNRSMPPASLVLPDQIIDYTWGREHTFVGALQDLADLKSMHAEFGCPYSDEARQALIQLGEGLISADRGVYGATQGPRLESAAEVRRLRNDGCDLVGMTGMPEAGLARELGLNYACIAITANWAAGFVPEEAEISLEDVLANISQAGDLLRHLLERLLDSD